ncbi:MAG: hypothetical protein KDI82_03510 [Gammaproteobacteria bacterium]|nr:hypothetical protein [Gammaproteobacteria bacterium]
MNQDINRLLMELERSMRSINHEVINPKITELTIDGLRPVLCLVANARARYLKALFDLGASQSEERPTEAQFEELRQLRSEYDELVNGAKALETAIQRGYLDVLPSKR